MRKTDSYRRTFFTRIDRGEKIMRKEKTLRIAGAGILLAAAVAAGVSMYQNEAKIKNQTETKEEQELAKGDTEEPSEGLSQGQQDVMESQAEESADVTTSDAQAEDTQELENTPEAENTEDSTTGTPTPSEQTGEAEDTAAEVLPTLDFNEDSTMVWPVSGQVLMDYSMDATTYFATLDLYKYNDALVFSASVDEPVQAAANGRVISISENEETGVTLTLDMGNGYQTVYGQLKDLNVSEGDVISSGTILGYVADPTKYYVKEGTNLYFAMEKDGAAVDPMIYLETVME